MNTHYAKQFPESWSPIANVFAALGDMHRQRILLLFEPNEALSIKEIVDVMPLSRTATVHHLTVLKQAGILHSTRKGKTVVYTVNEDMIITALMTVKVYIEARQRKQPENETITIR